jgi:aryl-alcohol dehydrogenase-like predicted oxidoreductase
MNEYRLLGKTGLRVSPLALGTMTFGSDWGWGADKDTCRTIFSHYVNTGGNLVDSADLYTGGRSEEFLGEFIRELGVRERIVIASKYSFSADPSNPNAGGNGRKNLRRALEGSLKRLKTEYIDLYFVHAYDSLTPVEEVMSTLNDMVREGKILHIGLSDVPAWYAARAQTIAEARHYEGVSVLQLEYSLIARNLEREHQPLARELGIGIMPWSPLAGGFLTGKYTKKNGQLLGSGRVKTTFNSGNPVFDKFDTPKNWDLLAVLIEVAQELGKTPAEVALNWVVNRPQVATTLTAATQVSQLELNMAALSFDIPESLQAKLDAASAPEPNELDHFFSAGMRAMLNGSSQVLR